MRLVHHHIPAFINNLPNFIKFFKPFIPEDLLTFKVCSHSNIILTLIKDRGEEVDVDIEKEATPPSAKSSKSRMKSSKKGFSARAEDESDDDVEYSKIPDDMKEELANAFAEPKTSDVVKKLVQKDHEDNEAKEQFVQAITEPNTNEVMRKLAKKNREKRERTNLDLSDSQDPYEATKEQLAESLSEPNTSDVMKKLAQKNKERLERQERERQERPASLIATDPTPPEHRRVRDRSRSRSRERPQTSESSSSQTVRRRQGRSKSRDRNQTSASGVDNDPNAAAKQQFAEALSDPDTSDVMKKLSQKNKEKRKGRSRSKSRDRGQATVVNPEHTEAQNESDLDAAKQLFGEALSDPDTSDVMKKLAQKNKDKMNRRSRSKSRDRGQASSVSPDPTPSVVIGTSQPEPILDPDMDAKRQFAETLSEPDSSDILKKLAQKRRERESVKPQEKVSNTGNNDEQKLNTGPSRTAPRRPDPSPLLGLEDFALSLALPESTDVVVRMTDRKDLREKGPPVREQSEPVLPSRMQSVVPATLSRGATSMSLQAAVPTISTPPISPTTPPLSSPARRQTLEDLSNSLIQPNTQDIMKKLAARNKTQAVATSQLLDQVIENVEEQIGSLQKLLEQLKDVKERGERSAHHIQDKEKPSDDSSGVLELASSSSVLVNPCMTTTPRTQATTEASTSTTSTTCTTNTPLVPKPVTVSSDLSAPRGSNIYQSADEYQSSLLFFQAQQQASQITSVILQAELESLKNRLGKEGAKTKAKSAYDSTLLLEDLLKQAAGIPKRPSPLAVSQVSTTPPQEIGSGRRSINYKTRPTSSRKKPVQPENEDGILDDILSKLSFRSRRSVIVKEREAKDLQPLERDALRLSIRLDGVDIDELMKTLHPELLK